MTSQKKTLFPLKLLLFHFHATNTIVLSFLPLYLAHKGLNGTEIGWILAIGPFASLISQPFWGYMSDKYKTMKRFLILSITGMLLSSIIFFQMNHLLALLLFGAILYFFSSPVGALSDSLAQQRANELNVSFGTIRTWGSIGFALSSLLVGKLLDHIGIGYIVIPYVAIGAVLLFISFTVKDVERVEAPVTLAHVKQMITYKPFILFLTIMMFITIAHRANDSFIGLYIGELGGTESLVGIAWFIGLVSEATVFALASFWFRSFHPIVFLIVASALYSIRWFLYGHASSPTTILSLQTLHGLTFGMFYVAAFDYVTKIIPKNLVATGHLFFYSVFFGVSGIIGSLTGGALLDSFSGQTLYFSMGVLSLLGMGAFVFYYVVNRNRQKTN
ncbi:MAG TPA: MFS transporter [Pseudogracilibacillus sp.]|nr:MFS transporter [Pseudogracilibacillus sp.]